VAWRRKPETPCRIYAAEIRVADDAPAELCEEACPSGALRLEQGRLAAEPQLCLVCLACMALCGPTIVIVPAWSCPGEEAAEQEEG